MIVNDDETQEDMHMKVEQFVMAYKVEQDRIRAMLPEGFQSLRPVLRINAEIRDGLEGYIEFNVPVSGFSKQGWLNIAHWKTPHTEISWKREGNTVLFATPFLEISFTGVGISGGCPAEKSNDGCYLHHDGKYELIAPEQISVRKEFCDCTFSWKFTREDASGVSIGEKSVAVTSEEVRVQYPHEALTPENAAHLPCLQMLGQYKVIFER